MKRFVLVVLIVLISCFLFAMEVPTSSTFNNLTYYYNFNDQGQLSNVTVLESGALSYQILYYRDPSTGSLVLSRRIYADKSISDTLFDDGYLFSDSKLINESSTINLDFPSSSEGFSTTITENGLTTIKSFNNKGLETKVEVFKEDSLLSSVLKEYDAKGHLIKKTSIMGENKVIDTYQNSMISLTEEFRNELKISETKINNNQKIQTLYENGKAYARITYDLKTSKTLKVEYL